MSCLIKPDGVVFNFICLLRRNHTFYINDYSLSEINNHEKKLLKASHLTFDDFQINKAFLLKQVTIISTEFMPDANLKEAYLLTADIDKYDVVFVATAIFLNGYLWTGDKPLYAGLKAKGFYNILNSTDIKRLLEDE
jgi:predicted nucleic acid-binding protein